MEIYQVKTKHKYFYNIKYTVMLQLNTPTPPPILLHNSSLKRIAQDFSNFRATTKKYQNYVHFWVINVNDNYLSCKVWKQTNKQIN